MKQVARDLARGLGLAMAAGLASFLVARYVLGRLYALSALLPAAMVSLLLAAWLLHLRADGFFGRAVSPEAQGREPPSPGEVPFAPFEADVLDRPGAAAWTARDLLRALLWGALVLGLASVALYRWGGVGAHFPG
jgi:hypothetical protein